LLDRPRRRPFLASLSTLVCHSAAGLLRKMLQTTEEPEVGVSAASDAPSPAPGRLVDVVPTSPSVPEAAILAWRSASAKGRFRLETGFLTKKHR
jgi:hypothetical protein